MPKGKDPATAGPHHTPQFIVDDSGLKLGVNALSNLLRARDVAQRRDRRRLIRVEARAEEVRDRDGCDDGDDRNHDHQLDQGGSARSPPGVRSLLDGM